MTRRTFWIILALGVVLRLLLIWQAELWYDENFSLVLARLPFWRMMAATIGDVHPPLHYLTIWPIGQIAGAPAWLIRLPSAAFSIIALALYPRILRILRAPAAVQVIAFVMLAVLPMQIHYAQEGRMYALLELLVILGVIAVLDDRPVLLGLATAGMLYSANYGMFYVAALVAVLVMVMYQQAERHRLLMVDLRAKAGLSYAAMKQIDPIDDSLRFDMRRRWGRLARGLAVGVAAWLPWLPVMLAQAKAIQGNYWIWDLHPGAVIYEIYKLFWSISLNTPAGNVAAMLLTAALLILAMWYLLARRPHSWLIIAALAFGPILLAIIVSLIFQPVLLVRPLIGVTPFLYLACAYPLGSITTARGRIYAACYIAPVVLLAVAGFYIYNPQQKTGQGTGSMREAAAFIESHWQPGDVVLHGSALGWVSLAPYMDGTQYAISNCTRKFPGSISPPSRDAIGIPDGDIDRLPPHDRIWFTAVFSPMLPECQAAHIESITAGREPALVLSESKFLLSAVWLLEE